MSGEGKSGRPKKYHEPMGTTTVTAPHRLLEEGRRRGLIFSEIFRDALRIHLGLEEEREAMISEAQALKARAELLEREAEARGDREARKSSMYAAFKLGGRPLGDRVDLSWLRARRVDFGLGKVSPRELLEDFKNRPSGREIV